MAAHAAAIDHSLRSYSSILCVALSPDPPNRLKWSCEESLSVLFRGALAQQALSLLSEGIVRGLGTAV